MRFDRRALAVIAGAVALQAGTAQVHSGVSMVVTEMNGGVAGMVCEPFDCTPHSLPLTADNTILVETYGLAGQPYILFAGPPTTQCFTLPWVLGAVAMDFPITIVDVGLVPAPGLPTKCGLDMAFTKIDIPSGAPIGAQLVLQTAAWPVAFDMPAFSRAVVLSVL